MIIIFLKGGWGGGGHTSSEGLLVLSLSHQSLTQSLRKKGNKEGGRKKKRGRCKKGRGMGEG